MRHPTCVDSCTKEWKNGRRDGFSRQWVISRAVQIIPNLLYGVFILAHVVQTLFIRGIEWKNTIKKWEIGG